MNYSGLMFIGDVFFSKVRPARRLDDDFLNTVIGKMNFVLNYAKSQNLKPIIIGSLVKKKFEIAAYSQLINLLNGHNALVVAGENEYVGASTIINEHSQCKLLADSGIIELVSKNGFCCNINVLKNNDVQKIGIFAYPEKTNIDTNIINEVKANEVDYSIILAKGKTTSSFFVKEDIEDKVKKGIKGVDLFVSDKGQFNLPIKYENTTFATTSPLLRSTVEQDSLTPKVLVLHSNYTLENISVPCEKCIFDMQGFEIKNKQNSYKQSEFTQMLKNEALKAKNKISTNDFIANELKDIFSKNNTDINVVKIIDKLRETTESDINLMDGIN